MKTIVRFKAGTGQFAVPVEDSCQVCPAQLVAMPDSGTEIAGVMEWGGVVINVLSPWGAAPRYVLVLDAGKGPFGLLVDEVIEVLAVPTSKFLQPPVGQRLHAVESLVHLGEAVVLVLDVKRFSATAASMSASG